MTENKTRRQRRTKASILEVLDRAAKEEIMQNGFSSALVTGIIKRANIEPQVFYNRYKDIWDFYEAFVRKYDFCLNDLLNKISDPIISREGVAKLLKEMMRGVNSDPILLELIRWELNDANKTTKRSATLRELNFQPLTQGFQRSFKGSGVDISGIITLMIGGIYYLSLHKKLSPFYGIDLNTEEGLAKADRVIDQLTDFVFEANERKKRDAEIAERLRTMGVSDEIIAKAIAPSDIGGDALRSKSDTSLTAQA